MTGPVLVLVGPPGAGKTTVGRLVADRLGVDFTDTDAAVEQTVGKPVPEIFLDEGEAAFRAWERDAVAAALATPGGVVALGGGAVLDAQTRSRLVGLPVVWLQVSVAAAAGRVGLARDRPVLALNPRAALVRLLEERRPFYAEVARATVDTAERSPDEVAADVLHALGRVSR